ncbi:MAG: glycosyltransferase family 4 protein [Bacteroidetes bacterium]|nr:glycosyltransferase family 4 protein [Bacteroidota bacterium]
MKRIILSVTNDLTSEQRVHKVCLFLQRIGFDVVLVGRLRRKSLPLEKRSYKTKRMFLLFEKGPLFYAEYNLHLFFYLLFHRAEILVTNDLDTLLANFFAAKINGCNLVHDSHEYFTGVPELQGRNFARSSWKKIEQWIFPKLKFVYTVNDSIAKLYKDEYGVDVKVVRNFPLSATNKKFIYKAKKDLELPEEKKIILYQGSVNIDRGLLETVETMQYVNDAVLLIVGDGDILEAVKNKTEKLNLREKIIFRKKVPFEGLKNYTACADIGISLDKDTNINYKFSLPNKIFDYLHAAVPVLASNLTEIKKIFSKYEIGIIIENHEPKHIAEKINFMLANTDKMKEWKSNCLLAAKEFCWENEEKILTEIYSRFV